MIISGNKVSKAVVQRAKSILACSPDFFSATSPHQRIRGIELHERLIRNLVETMLEIKEGGCLTVTEAYQLFRKLSHTRNLDQLKRSIFKETMRDLIKDKFGMCLRNDVPDEFQRHQQAWKGLKLVEVEALTS